MPSSQQTTSKNSNTFDPAYYRVLEYMQRIHGSNRKRQLLYAIASASVIVAAGIWAILMGELSSDVATMLALAIVSLMFLFLFLIGPRTWDLISLKHISKERVEECTNYIEEHCEEWEFELVSQMAENDRNGMQTVSALMNTLWPALIALLLAGVLLPPNASSYLILAGLLVFIILPVALLRNSEREHADAVILQAIIACKERREKSTEIALGRKLNGAITRKLHDI